MCGTRKSDDILIGDMVENSIGGTTNQLQTSFRQNFRINDIFHHCFGKKRSDRGRFNYSRNTCHEIHGNFLQHSPNREIECIDMYSHSMFRNADMMPDESSVLGKFYGITFETERGIRKLLSQTRIGEKVSDAAFDIDPTINPGSTR